MNVVSAVQWCSVGFWRPGQEVISALFLISPENFQKGTLKTNFSHFQNQKYKIKKKNLKKTPKNLGSFFPS